MIAKLRTWLPVALALTGFALLATPRSAHAQTLELRAFVDGVLEVDVLDNSAGDNNPAIGLLGLGSTSVPLLVPTPGGGNLQVFASLSTSNATSPSALSQLTSQSLNVINTTGAGHTVLLQISDVSYRFPPSPLTLTGTASGTFSPVATTGNTTVDGATATARSWADNTNVKFGTQFLVQSFTTPAATTPDLLSYANSQTRGGFTYSNPPGYSMTVELSFFLPNNVQLNGRSNVVQAVGVPEPSTLAMAGMGALSLLGYGLRRYRKLAA